MSPLEGVAEDDFIGWSEGKAFPLLVILSLENGVFFADILGMKFKNPIVYNAPVTLSFTIICTVVLFLDRFVFDNTLVLAVFSAPECMTEKNGFDFNSALHYLRLFTHIFGHADWAHLLSNLAYILLLGPLMEERYGSKMIALMIFVTALVTGVINVCLIPSILLGASGICFMLIVLSSLNVIDKKKIPLSFIFLVIVYVAKEFVGNREDSSNISVAAHIAGGLCGSLFGFLVAPKEKRASKVKSKSASTNSSSANSATNSASTTKKSSSPQKFAEQESEWREKWEKIRRERLDKIKEQQKSSNANNIEEDTTVVGTLKL